MPLLASLFPASGPAHAPPVAASLAPTCDRSSARLRVRSDTLRPSPLWTPGRGRESCTQFCTQLGLSIRLRAPCASFRARFESTLMTLQSKIPATRSRDARFHPRRARPQQSPTSCWHCLPLAEMASRQPSMRWAPSLTPQAGAPRYPTESASARACRPGAPAGRA